MVTHLNHSFPECWQCVSFVHLHHSSPASREPQLDPTWPTKPDTSELAGLDHSQNLTSKYFKVRTFTTLSNVTWTECYHYHTITLYLPSSADWWPGTGRIRRWTNTPLPHLRSCQWKYNHHIRSRCMIHGMVIKVVYDGINTRALMLTQVCKSQCMSHCSVLTIGWNIVMNSPMQLLYYVQVTVVPCIGGGTGGAQWGQLPPQNISRGAVMTVTRQALFIRYCILTIWHHCS